MMFVTVPDGMQGGQMLAISTPAGMLQAQIPAGLQPGETFQIEVPPAPPQPAPMPPPLVAPELPLSVTAEQLLGATEELSYMLRAVPPCLLSKEAPELAHALRRCS
jgi:hypothetical protein